ncbi:citrate/2-methylcitrate synthase [Sinomonas susongensis]|uniref:citrate/2-methylcitrate synthase n=1 Tax=Sinomonas susongensis TaxID=1324851 RepID=UPI001FE52CDF|nr:citrate/2-methylcitrate synthase [Sinomonas susongensis]
MREVKDPTTIDRVDETLIDVPRGLRNVVVAETMLSDVRGSEGFYTYRQFSATDLARRCSVEEVWWLLIDGELPEPGRFGGIRSEIAAAAVPSSELQRLVATVAASASADLLGAVKAAVALDGALRGSPALFDLDEPTRRTEVVRAAAQISTLIAALTRLSNGQTPLMPRPELGFAENYLYMLDGAPPTAERARALSTYLVAAIDHGFNASTFTARLIASTGADVSSCFVGALGSLSGPLHGGAPSRVLDMLDAIGTVENIDPWVTERVLSHQKIMGFGHPVYRVEDPRSRLLKEVAQRFEGPRVQFAIQVEERIPFLLEKLKPGRHLHTNLEWYAAVVMEQVGLSRSLFTPTFAAARALGWAPHILEQAADPKIIRPSARYGGPPAPQPLPR